MTLSTFTCRPDLSKSQELLVDAGDELACGDQSWCLAAESSSEGVIWSILNRQRRRVSGVPTLKQYQKTEPE